MYLSSIAFPLLPYDKEMHQAGFFALLCNLIAYLALRCFLTVMKLKHKDFITDKGFFSFLFPFSFGLASEILKDLPFESGVLWSLQWDYFLSGLAGLIWVGELYSKTFNFPGPGGNSIIRRFVRFAFVSPAAARPMVFFTCIGGPCGAVNAMYNIASASSLRSDSSPSAMAQSGHFVIPDRETGIASDLDKQKELE